MSLLKRIGANDVVSGRDGQERAVQPAPGLKVLSDQSSASNSARRMDLKARVQAKLISELDPRLDLENDAEVRRTVEESFAAILEQENIVLSRAERNQLFEAIAAEILGYGPIETLINDSTITEIMVNGPDKVYVERLGKIAKTGIRFQNNEHVMRIIERIVAPLGRRIDESSPMVDARLPDGSRVNVIIPPLSLVGPTITIRKFSAVPLTTDDLIKFGTVSSEMVTLLKACVQARLNMVISGGTGSGKTTTLNVLSSFIPDDERIITIENAAELQMEQEHVITLESRPPNIEGRGEVTMRDLVINALRMRPDRIIVGECRGGEALDMLQAMNTGHEGSMTTCHSNSPRDTLSRLETMVLMAGMELPVRAIRDQVTSAIDLIVHQERLKDGTRRITTITEVLGMEGDVIVLQDLFRFERVGTEEGKIIGRMKPTGIRPRFSEKLEKWGIYLPPNMFGTVDKYF